MVKTLKIVQWIIRSQVLRYFLYTMDAVHRLNVGGVFNLFNKLNILRYSRALGEIQVFGQSYIIKRVKERNILLIIILIYTDKILLYNPKSKKFTINLIK